MAKRFDIDYVDRECNYKGYCNVKRSDIDFIMNKGIPRENIILFDYVVY